MSFSTFFGIAVILGTYRLGVYNTRHPGEFYQRAQQFWKWFYEQRR